VKVKCPISFYRPEEISAMILQKIKPTWKQSWEKKLAKLLYGAGLFNDAQRKATKDAGQIAGLDVKKNN